MKSEERRPMSAALKTVELPPEALSLIREGTPQPKVDKPKLATIARPEPEEEPKRPVRPKNEPEPSQGLAFLSFRLPQEIAQGLLKASLDRKLNRIKPWTQQEITAEALSGWLRKQGYLN
jgi:hypothetical protein